MHFYPSSAFILYCKQEASEEQVLHLSDFLLRCGVNCEVDLYHADENVTNWASWVGEHLKQCIDASYGYIIMVCSQTMMSALNNSSTNDRIEMFSAHIDRLALLYYLEKGAPKTLPLFFTNPSDDFVPANLSGKTIYHFPYDKLLEEINEVEQTNNLEVQKILAHPDFESLKNLVATLTKSQ